MELRFVNRESDFLVFETSEGEKLRALVDDQLRDAVRNSQQITNSGISPREVQNRIRAGEKVEAIAEALGVPTSTIEPFAAPILDELNYVLEAALSTEVNDGNKMGEMVAAGSLFFFLSNIRGFLFAYARADAKIKPLASIAAILV